MMAAHNVHEQVGVKALACDRAPFVVPALAGPLKFRPKAVLQTSETRAGCHGPRPWAWACLRLTAKSMAPSQTVGILLVLFIVLLQPSSATAQNWSTNPYKVKVWLALQNAPEVQSVGTDRVAGAITRHADGIFGAAWSLSVVDAPPSLAPALARDVGWPDFDTILAADEKIEEHDKLFLVGASLDNGALQIKIRELDTRSRQWRVVESRNIRQSSRLDEAIAESVIGSFTPVGLIGRSKDGRVTVTMKAGLLTGNAVVSRILPPAGTILTGVTRRSDRLGKVIENGIIPIPWTLLRVESQDQKSGTIECSIVSGLRSPLRARSSRQVERIGMVVKSSLPATILRLHKRDDETQSLAGYDVYYRLPDEKSTTFIGRTDWQGQIEIPKDEHDIKVLYVKNGGRILARLPVVPGHQSRLSAPLADDSRRLEAEGFLKGIQEQMVEITTRRRVLALRIRRAIEDRRFEKAEELLDEMRGLQSRDDLNRKMRERQQSFSSNDRSIQDRIDKMFRKTRDVLLRAENAEKQIEPSIKIDTLRSELASAK